MANSHIVGGWGGGEGDSCRCRLSISEGYTWMLDSHTAGIDLDATFLYQRDSPRCCISVQGGFTGLPVKAKIREKKWELGPGLPYIS